MKILHVWSNPLPPVSDKAVSMLSLIRFGAFPAVVALAADRALHGNQGLDVTRSEERALTKVYKCRCCLCLTDHDCSASCCALLSAPRGGGLWVTVQRGSKTRGPQTAPRWRWRAQITDHVTRIADSGKCCFGDIYAAPDVSLKVGEENQVTNDWGERQGLWHWSILGGFT